jgi:hypothetical protein
LREVTLEEAIAERDEVAAIGCERILSCCTVDDPAFRMDACTRLWGANIALADGPRILIDDGQKELCLEVSSQLTCDDVLPEECQGGRWMMGGADAGEACERHQDCIWGQGGDATCVEGLCYQNPRGRLGEVCRASVDDIGQRTTHAVDDEWREFVAAECYRSDGLYCAGPSGCQPVHELGAACENSSQCDVSLVCEADTCAEPPPLGTPCSFTVDCGADAWCDESCVALSERGESCESSSDCRALSCLDDTCGGIAERCERIMQGTL